VHPKRQRLAGPGKAYGSFMRTVPHPVNDFCKSLVGFDVAIANPTTASRPTGGDARVHAKRTDCRFDNSRRIEVRHGVHNLWFLMVDEEIR
jgi:hypothetical protein